MLTRYSAMVRTLIESHGGVVEKFIGDAVVGVFGVPAAHEDDPERAVRGLACAWSTTRRDSRDSGVAPCGCGSGCNTGEALVRVSVAPGVVSDSLPAMP